MNARLTGPMGGGSSVHPLREVVAGLERGGDLIRIHLGVLVDVLGVLPLEEFDAVLGIRLAAKVAVSRGLLILGLAKREGHGDGARAASNSIFSTFVMSSAVRAPCSVPYVSRKRDSGF